MIERLAGALVLMVELYLGLGLLFAVAFAWRGVQRVDPRARGSRLGFRLLLVPGAAALWPLLAGRWLRGAPPPVERNAHRALARRAGAGSPGGRE
jgi:hypothetical protein